MQANKETLVVLAEEIAAVFYPLRDALESFDSFEAFMNELGWDISEPPPPIGNLATPLNLVIDSLETGTIDGSNVAGLITKITALINDIKNLQNEPGNWLPASVDANQFKNEFPGQLVQYLFVEYFLGTKPRLGSLLKAIGVIKIQHQPGTADRMPYWRKGVAWQELGNFFNDPTGVFTSAYNWGGSGFLGLDFIENYAQLGRNFGLPIEQVEVTENMRTVLNQGALDPNSVFSKQLRFVLWGNSLDNAQITLGIGLFLLPETATAKPGFVVLPFASGGLSQAIALTETLQLLLDINADLNLGLGITIRPGKVNILTDIIGSGGQAPPSSLRLKMGMQYARPDGPTILLGTDDGSRLEIGSFAVHLGGAVATNGDNELLTEAELKGGKLVIKPGKGDSFLKKILGEKGIEGNFDLTLGWSSKLGVYFLGSGGLEIALPTHISLGPIEIQGFTIGVKPKAGAIPIELGADVQGNLGPLTAMVKGIGFKAVFTFPNDNSGNLGPLHFAPEFKWPTGVGLSIDGGGFVGGGFLFLDYDKGEYAGGLELEFRNTIALKAIGVLNTKMPDGSDGFSLIIIITAEFIPIQLGFGFTLNGVGGLLGLNRTMVLDALRLGVYDGSLNSILFPKDVVANANRIIADVQRIFPPYEGNFIFGPMAKLGWGTPTLISLELGLVIEVPDPVRLALLGVMRLNLPTEELAIVYIQINFLAAIDFDKKQFSLDASLVNSRILTFALTGDMAIRIFWGDDANFLFTVGGFHPAYKPPPLGLPPLKRLSLVIFSGHPDVRAESYFALTSNTVQFGAKLSLRASAGPAEVHGYLSLDALIQFNPFYFLVSFGAMLAVRIFGEDLLSVQVEMSLEGPAPWHAWGKAKVSISFFFFSVSVTVKFDVTFGKDQKKIAPPVEVFEPLVKALRHPGNWEAQTVPGTNIMVSLRQISKEEQGDDLILHPAGVVQVSQKVVPLYLEINKFGENVPKKGQTYFEIASLKIGDQVFEKTDLKEQFAPSHFRKMTDAEKLSKKSFEKYQGGVRLKGSDKLQASYQAALDAAYELSYIPDTRQIVLFMVLEFLSEILLKNSAVAKSPLAHEPNRPSALDAPKMAVRTEPFVIVQADTLAMHRADLEFESEAEADVAYQTLIAKDPALVTQLAVMPKYQLN